MSQQQPNYPQALEDAFNTFNQLSSQLADSYQALEIRVAQLNEELADSRDERIKELTEKERLANRLSALLSALPAGVVVLDQHGKVQEYNPAAIELLGEPLHGIAWQDVITRAFAPRADDDHDISLTDGRRVSISTCPLGSEPGQILLLTDVTEVRKLQNRLNQHQRLAAMGEMAASLAHQIRTPLSSAILYASSLKQHQLSEAQRQHSSEKIIARLRHLEHVVNDMLLYARGGNPGSERFEVSSLFDDLQSTLEAQLEVTQTGLTVMDKTQGLWITGNREMLLSAMVNLAVNAIQAMGQQGRIDIQINKHKSSCVQIIFSDTGPGFSEQGIQQAFEPFYTTRKEGTGLGLAVVEAIISAHGGEVSLASRPGSGSTFTIELPVIDSGISRTSSVDTSFARDVSVCVR